MGSLIADNSALLEDLRMSTEPVEVYDTSGKLLGLFVPANLERGKQLHAAVMERIDWAEMDRRRRSAEPGAPMHEVLGRLRQLEAEVNRRQQAGEPALAREEALAFVRALREKAGQQ